MTPEQRTTYFLDTAPTVFGEHWKTNVARFLAVSTVTVRNWWTGERLIPLAVIKLLQNYMQRQAKYDAETGKMIIRKEESCPKTQSSISRRDCQ